MTPDHVPLKLTGGDGVIAVPPQLAASREIKLTTVRQIHLRIETPTGQQSNNSPEGESIPGA